MSNPKNEFAGKGTAELNYFLGLGNEAAGFASQGKRKEPQKGFGTLKLPHHDPVSAAQADKAGPLPALPAEQPVPQARRRPQRNGQAAADDKHEEADRNPASPSRPERASSTSTRCRPGSRT